MDITFNKYIQFIVFGFPGPYLKNGFDRNCQVAVFFHSAVAVWVFGDAQITGTKNFLFDTSEASSYVAEVSKILGNQAP